MRRLESLAETVYGGKGTVWSWSCVNGLAGSPGEPDTRDLLRAIAAVPRATAAMPPRRDFAIFRDLPAFFDRPEVVRALREAYLKLSKRDCFFSSWI